jgi:cell wall-associated NlpC family hydrolase
MRILSAVMVLTAATIGSGCAPSNVRTLPRGALVMRAAYQAEPKATEQALQVLAFASAQIGRPYCWGGMGPMCFDCSGLAGAAWMRAGARVPRTTGDIAGSLPEVPLEEIRAGDILWWPGHVGIYAGHGWVVDALDSRHGVVVRPAADPYRAFRPRG